MSTDDPLPPPIQDPAPEIQAQTPAPAAAARPAYEAALEQFAREYLRERRIERRWRFFYRVFWLLVVGAVLWAVFVPHNRMSTPSTPHTALVEVRGEIADGSDASAELIVAALKDAFAEPGAQAIVMRFNSPGGSPVQAGIVNDEINRLRSQYHKKVYAVCEEICASGAYYMAAAADEIYVDKASVVGSIGVLMDGFGFTGVMEKYGVERRLITAGSNKGMLDPFSPLPARQRAYAQAMLDQIHQQFIDVVREGRGKRLKETPDTFTGLFWNGEEAVKMGLADDFGNLDYVAREVIKAEDVIDYTPRDNVAERLAKRFGAAMGESAIKTLRSLPSIR